jgi:tetrahydromethanopterin S-methyltransferase subunit G
VDAQNQVKEMLTCPVCGKQFYRDMDGSEIGFCPFCGTKMSFNVGTTFEEIGESKGNDISNASEESKESIELTESSVSKENVEIKETDESLKDTEIKAADELKDNNEPIVSGELKENGELKESVELRENIELKDSIELKEAGELKANNDPTAINEPQDSNTLNEADRLKEIDAPKPDQFEIKDENAVQPVLQPVLGYNPEQDKAASENLNPGGENTDPKIEEVKQDAELTQTEPKKEGKPYDVIFGIILLAIGIILIFVYVVFTPNGIIGEQNTEATRVQTEQTAEQNPGR